MFPTQILLVLSRFHTFCRFLKMNFSCNKNKVEFGDTAIVYFGHDKIDHILVQKDQITQTKYGAIRHNQLAGHKYGHKFNSTKGWVYILKPTPELWTLSLPHRTQILYSTDIAMITFQLDLKPGDVVCESGTGSGSLSHAILRTISPHGHLHTTEFHEQRAHIVSKEFKDHGYEKCVTVHHGDVLENGFSCTGLADAVFLDIPKPWEAIKHAVTAFKPEGGRFCSFSPCIEQVQKTCQVLRDLNFRDLNTIELVQKNHNIRKVLLPVADIGLSSDEIKENFFNSVNNRNTFKCAYEPGDKLEVGELLCNANLKLASNKANNEDSTAKRARIETINGDSNRTLETPRKGFTPPTAKAMFSTRTYVLPKQIYGHTGYLTFASYCPI